MNRRLWVIETLLFVGGVSLIPSCMNDAKKSSVQLTNFAVVGDDESLLGGIVETIVPLKDNAATKDVNLHLFVLKMVDDCYTKEDQALFVNGLKKFNDYSKQVTGKAFLDNPIEKKITVCKSIATNKIEDNDIRYFLNTTKSLTILGYTQSKYFMTKVVPYELIPGRFNGCVKVNSVINHG